MLARLPALEERGRHRLTTELLPQRLRVYIISAHAKKIYRGSETTRGYRSTTDRPTGDYTMLRGFGGRTLIRIGGKNIEIVERDHPHSDNTGRPIQLNLLIIHSEPSLAVSEWYATRRFAASATARVATITARSFRRNRVAGIPAVSGYSTICRRIRALLLSKPRTITPL